MSHPAATPALSAPRSGTGLPAYGLFAGLLAMAGLPIYIHAPKFYVDEYGVTLGALAGALFLLRLLDFVQDPALGWLAARLHAARGLAVAVAGAVMALAMLGLFAVSPPLAPVLWFALMLTALFSAFSFLTIAFYATGAQKGEVLGDGGHVRLAGWRETGALLGVCLAAAAPSALMLLTDSPFAAFAMGFALLAALALWAMAAEWARYPLDASPGAGFGVVLGDSQARRLLIVAFLNATPVAVTSTLFLFFVETRLELPGWEGPLLLLFFLAAAVSAPLWARLADRIGARRALLAGMTLAIVTFAFALTLGPGDLLAFALICLASGAALGADMTLLAAIFARRMARVAPDAGQAFGLWAFVSKATLAVAALTVLPALEAAGLTPGAPAPDQALWMLTILYAGLPCVLKLIALALLARSDLKDS